MVENVSGSGGLARAFWKAAIVPAIFVLNWASLTKRNVMLSLRWRVFDVEREREGKCATHDSNENPVAKSPVEVYLCWESICIINLARGRDSGCPNNKTNNNNVTTWSKIGTY